MDVREKYVMQKVNRKEKSICPNCIHHNLCIAENNQPCFECNRFIDAHGVTVQEWISVNDRLPKADGTKVIVTNGVCSWEDYLGVYDKWVVQSNSLLKKHKRPVTHWMYMPVRREVLGK